MRSKKQKAQIFHKVDEKRPTVIEVDEPTVLHLSQEISIKVDKATLGKNYEVRVWNDDPRSSGLVYEFIIKPTQSFPVKEDK